MNACFDASDLSNAELRELAELQAEEYRRLAREDILAFTTYTKPDYKINWHHRALAKKLNDFAYGRIRFLMVFEPPRHGKSEQVSRRLPAFLHGLYPNSDIMAGSYSSSLANDMTADVQRIMDTPRYREVFPDSVIPLAGTRDPRAVRNSEEHHLIGRTGKYRGQGVGGSFTGKGARFIIIDDPIKGREQANSEAFRESLWHWYTNDLRTRLEGATGQILITLTRWHEDDLAGRLLEKMKTSPEYDQFEIFCLPAIKEDDSNPEDIREIGEALWKDKMPLSELAAIRAGDERAFQSLYQQNPRSQGGNLFKDTMFDHQAPPAQFDWSFIMVDTAYNDKQENDFSVAIHFGVRERELYCNDMWREHIKAADMEAPLAAFIKKHTKYGFRGVYIEPKGHGIYLNQMLPRKGILLPSADDIKTFFQDRRLNKVERANNILPQLTTRKIHINPAITNRDQILREVLGFPTAKHDDITDCIIDGVKLVFARELTSFDVL